jgi:hypothetical protein
MSKTFGDVPVRDQKRDDAEEEEDHQTEGERAEHARCLLLVLKLVVDCRISGGCNINSGFDRRFGSRRRLGGFGSTCDGRFFLDWLVGGSCFHTLKLTKPARTCSNAASDDRRGVESGNLTACFDL